MVRFLPVLSGLSSNRLPPCAFDCASVQLSRRRHEAAIGEAGAAATAGESPPHVSPVDSAVPPEATGMVKSGALAPGSAAFRCGVGWAGSRRGARNFFWRGPGVVGGGWWCGFRRLVVVWVRCRRGLRWVGWRRVLIGV
jgi:hypothetical protein